MNTKSLFVWPLRPHKGSLQPHEGPYAIKPKVFEIEGSNFVSKPLKGKELPGGGCLNVRDLRQPHVPPPKSQK